MWRWAAVAVALIVLAAIIGGTFSSSFPAPD